MSSRIYVLAMLLGQALPAAAQDQAQCPAGSGPDRLDPASELIGHWRGGIQQGGAIVLRLAVEFAPAPCGQLSVTMDSPDQGVEDIPVNSVAVIGDSLRFEVASLSASFRGELDAGRTKVAGIWTQGPTTIGMALTRGDSAISFSRPQHPSPPFPYTEKEAAYQNEVDGTRLAGTLTLPEGDGPFPAALLLTGSGAQDRDESLMGHKPFLVIADYLSRRGIAVLRVDDRGVGGSAGNVMDATIADNVRDAAAAVGFLRGHPRIDPRRVGLIGHSEGGWVAPALALELDDVAFVVMLAGPAVSPYDLLAAQTRAVLEASGDVLVEEQVALSRGMLDVIREEPDDERAIAAMRQTVAAWLLALPPDVAAQVRAQTGNEAYQAQLTQSMRTQTTPWFRGLLAYDPMPALAALDVPALALFGERDLQVPPAQSVPALEAIWADHPDATIHTFPGLNHLFQHAETGLIAEYAQIEETFAPEALEMVAGWIERRFVR
jgi:hypothetical protein